MQKNYPNQKRIILDATIPQFHKPQKHKMYMNNGLKKGMKKGSTKIEEYYNFQIP